jgi:hypothetical protein
MLAMLGRKRGLCVAARGSGPPCAEVEPPRRPACAAPVSDGLTTQREHTMTIVRCIDCEFDNARMTAGGFEIICIEDYRWPDRHAETEILWARDEAPISEHDLPF